MLFYKNLEKHDFFIARAGWDKLSGSIPISDITALWFFVYKSGFS